MKTKHIILIAFVTVVFIQLMVPARMITTYERILDSGKEYRFKIAPVDPNDPLRGKFIRINPEEREFAVDSLNDWKNNESVYVKLTTDAATGMSKIKSIVREKPQDTNDFIEVKLGYVQQKRAFIEFPFDRYYLDEWTAPQIEKLYSKAQRDTNSISYVKVRVIDGEAVLKDLVINGMSATEINPNVNH